MIWNLLTILLILWCATSFLYLLYGIVQLTRIEQKIDAALDRLKNRGGE